MGRERLAWPGTRAGLGLIGTGGRRGCRIEQ
jgi:hypothetical protein